VVRASRGKRTRPAGHAHRKRVARVPDGGTSNPLEEVMNMDGQSKQMKVVYTVVERAPGKSYWTRVGVGFVNSDGSMNLRLDAIPVNGSLQIRDWEPPGEWERRRAEQGEASRSRTKAPAPADSLL
jgi:hypothetical protein